MDGLVHGSNPMNKWMIWESTTIFGTEVLETPICWGRFGESILANDSTIETYHDISTVYQGFLAAFIFNLPIFFQLQLSTLRG